MSGKKIKIGTRSSKLALWQAHYVAHLLAQGGLQSELVPIETKGDKMLQVALSKIGSKGVFTEELEGMLQQGKVDIAVHSAKDVQSTLPEDFYLLAFCEREAVEDVIVAEKTIDLQQRDLVLGTSSTRRVALLKHLYPHINTVAVRGNLQTRMAKLQSGSMHGLVLAYAGVKRMKYEKKIKHHFDPHTFVPPVGQGAIAIEAHRTLDQKVAEAIKSLTNHVTTEKTIRAERAFLKKMDGGCSIPVFGYARLQGAEEMELVGGIVSLEGTQKVQTHLSGTDPEKLGEEVADQVLKKGGEKILNDIKSALSK